MFDEIEIARPRAAQVVESMKRAVVVEADRAGDENESVLVQELMMRGREIGPVVDERWRMRRHDERAVFAQDAAQLFEPAKLRRFVEMREDGDGVDDVERFVAERQRRLRGCDAIVAAQMFRGPPDGARVDVD